MRVGHVATKGLVNYSVAVAALPLGLVGPGGVQLPEVSSARPQTRSTVSSESGYWLEAKWADMQDELARVALRVPVRHEVDVMWFETADDAVYPTSPGMQVLSVPLVHDPSADEFTFTDDDFDVWG